jgi:tetratricopeptide (TPR) repeat protein
VYPELLGRYPLSDRQLYVPLALTGALLAGWGAGIEARRPRIGRGLIGVLVAGLCFGLSIDIRRMPVWQDDVALFSAATKANPHSAFGWNALGRAALERFRSIGLDADLKLAQEAYQTTLDLALGAARQRLSALGFALPNAGPDEPKERELDWIASVDLIEANLGLSWCLLHEAELDSYRDFAVPQALFERVLRAAPESSDAHAGLAIALYLQGDLPGARENLRQALALAPDSAALHRQAARLAHAASDFDTARRHAERAIALDPASAEGFLWLARAELELGHLEQARRAAQSASERAPQSSAPVVLLGMVAGQQGSLESALGQFDAALKLDPDDAQAHAQRGKALFGLRQVEAALFAWRTAVELDASLFEPQYNLASELLRLGQAAAAQPHLRQAYAHCPSAELRTLMRGTLSNLAQNDATSLRTLASVDRRRDLESAVEWARLATVAEPKTAANWELYGSLLTNAARPLDALQAFEQAAQQGASGFLFERARAFALADAALPEAEAALKRVLTLLPDESQLDPSVLASWREEIEARIRLLPQGPVMPR